MKVLVIGGSRYFGKLLVGELIRGGHEVTVLNRQTHEDDFGDKIRRLKCDRTIKSMMVEVLGNQSWDVVYDQVCYDYDQAIEACEIFSKRVGKYIFTSSQSVYGFGEDLKEEDFDPKKYKLGTKMTTVEDYAEAKRQAEHAFHCNADFPVISLRLPIVIGLNDPTERFKWHIDRLVHSQPIYVSNKNAKISFIDAKGAAETLYFLAEVDHTGPVNSAALEPVELLLFLNELAEFLNSQLHLALQPDSEDWSPYGIEKSWYMNLSLIRSLGYKPKPISSWLKGLTFEVEKTIK